MGFLDSLKGHRHVWSEWSDPKKSGSGYGAITVQERQCSGCKKVEQRKVKIKGKGFDW